VHEEYVTNLALSLHGYWVYDFALPLLILHAFTFKTMENLKHWLNICPRRQITVLDTHDGMGIDDIAGLAEVVCLLSACCLKLAGPGGALQRRRSLCHVTWHMSLLRA
jgi:hypothetical protein